MKKIFLRIVLLHPWVQMYLDKWKWIKHFSREVLDSSLFVRLQQTLPRNKLIRDKTMGSIFFHIWFLQAIWHGHRKETDRPSTHQHCYYIVVCNCNQLLWTKLRWRCYETRCPQIRVFIFALLRSHRSYLLESTKPLTLSSVPNYWVYLFHFIGNSDEKKTFSRRS